MRYFRTCTGPLILLLLASPVAADQQLPASFLRVPDSVTTLFVAETSESKFHRFARVDGDLIKTDSFYMSIGQNGPGKESSGDKRTPLGIYFVTEELNTSKLHEKYGVTAFPLDYPNEWDQRSGRDGDGIWVHGVHPTAGVRPARDTDGCIALANDDLIVLRDDFDNNVTPVVVTSAVGWSDTGGNDVLARDLQAHVQRWADSQATGDLHAFLSLYDEKFARWGMGKAEWASLILRNSATDSIVDADVSDLLLMAYPEESGLFLSRFRLTLVENGRAIDYTTRLYWQRNETGALRIIAQDAG